jgi:DNA-binding MurR/RpiR family transcriptional regulator
MNEQKTDLIKLIQQSFPRLSKGQRLIAEYIMSHYEKAAFMTAGKLGEMVGVSESTVVRFAIALGFDGYPILQKALQEMIKTKLTTVQRIEMTSDLVNENDMVRKVLKSDIENIRRTLEEMDTAVFYEVIDRIMEARNVYILGLRSSMVLADFLGYYLNLILDNVRVVSQGINEIYEQLFNVREGDLVIAISFPRYSRRTVEAINFVKRQGADILAITDGPLSPLLNYADYTLFARSNMASIVDSLVAPMSLINALIISVSMREKEKAMDIFSRLEEIWGQYHTYSNKDKSSV